MHRSNTNGTTTVAVNGASEPVAISSSLSIPTSSSLDSDVLNQRIMIKHTSPKLTTFATLASSVNSYEESTTLHSSTTRFVFLQKNKIYIYSTIIMCLDNSSRITNFYQHFKKFKHNLREDERFGFIII